jgi:monovalent cation:H+ antiporter-2, CPA2 family
LATPIRDMFAALFFVSVGALMDITLLPLFIVPALVLIVVSLAAKFLTVYVAAAKYQRFIKLTSLRAGIGLSSSGGALALVVAKGGTDVGVTSSFLLRMVGAMRIITTFISPYIIKFGWKFAENFVNKSKKLNNNNKIRNTSEVPQLRNKYSFMATVIWSVKYITIIIIFLLKTY